MDLEEQTEAIFKTSGKDPISGNDVPVGSLPEEVRDDIPAQLSEGEYVVPADVVRYYGVKFFEDLRMDAKRGFAQMDADGRIGGEPIDAMDIIEPKDDLPFDISELQTVEAAEGTFVTGYEEGGMAQPFTPALIAGNSGVTYVDYTNGTDTIKIPFFNGVAMAVIPEGYMPVSEFEAKKQKAQEPAQQDDDDKPRVQPPEPIDFESLTDEELEKMVNDQTSFGTDDVVTGLMAALNPIMGLFIKGAMLNQAKMTRNELERRINDKTGTYSASTKSKYEEMLERSKNTKGILQSIFGKKEEVKPEEEYTPTGEAEPPVTDSATQPIVSVEKLEDAGVVENVTQGGKDKYSVSKMTYSDGTVTYLVIDNNTGERALEGLQETDQFDTPEAAQKEADRLAGKDDSDDKEPKGMFTSPAQPEGMSGDFKMPSTTIPTEEDDDDEEDPFDTQARARASQTGVATAASRKRARDMAFRAGYTGRNLSGKSMKAGVGVGSGRGGSDLSGPMNKGGLASKKKKTK